MASILEIHPLDQNHFIGTIGYEERNASNEIQTVILLDQSGSMGDQTRRFARTIIPMVMSKLAYEKHHKAHLIAFASMSSLYSRTAEEFKSLDIKSAGIEKMAPAVGELHRRFQSFDASKPVRVLTISDGEISDREGTETNVAALVSYLKACNFSINSQAVRLFTSSRQPDTKALCSLLQINNTTTCQLADIGAKESDESIATEIANLFLNDNFANSQNLTMTERIILTLPWEPSAASQFMLLPGVNLFWLKKVPISAMIGHKPAQVISRVQLTLTTFQQLMEEKLVYILDHMKILKSLGTDKADESVKVILNYFETTETELAKNSSGGEKQISVLLAEIASDENFKNLNPERMAEYLREITEKQKEAASRRKKEAEEQRRKQEAEELRKKQEAEELRRKQEAEAEETRKRQEAQELCKKQEAEEARKIQEAEELRKKQEAEAEEARKIQEAEELRKKREIEAEEARKIQEAEELRKKQEAEAEEERKIQEAEDLRKKQEVEAEQARKIQAAEELRKKREAEAEEARKIQEAEGLRKKRETEAEEATKIQETEGLRKKQETETEEARKIQEAEELRKKQEAKNFFFTFIDLILKSKFNFFLVVFFVIFAIIEIKLQLKSKTHSCEAY